jgi:DNA-binding Lrp family transcriptional regulator
MEVQEEVEDDEHLGCSSTSKTEENVEKISEILQKDRRLSIQMIAEMVNMDKETVR